MGFIQCMLNMMVAKKEDSCLFAFVNAIQSWLDDIKGQKKIHTLWKVQTTMILWFLKSVDFIHIFSTNKLFSTKLFENFSDNY